MPKKASNTRTIYRSAKTGRLVTKKYADSHPNTTEKERRPVKKKSK
jgi:hypothetical protein